MVTLFNELDIHRVKRVDIYPIIIWYPKHTTIVLTDRVSFVRYLQSMIIITNTRTYINFPFRE